MLRVYKGLPVHLIFAAALYWGGITMAPTEGSGSEYKHSRKFIVHKSVEPELSQLFWFQILHYFCRTLYQRLGVIGLGVGQGGVPGIALKPWCSCVACTSISWRVLQAASPRVAFLESSQVLLLLLVQERLLKNHCCRQMNNKDWWWGYKSVQLFLRAAWHCLINLEKYTYLSWKFQSSLRSLNKFVHTCPGVIVVWNLKLLK